MSDAQLEHIRATVDQISTKLELHDQRVQMSVATITDKQDRIETMQSDLVTAVRTIATATTEIKRLADSASAKPNGKSSDVKLTPKLVAMLVGGGLILGAVFKGGGEGVSALLSLLAHVGK